MLLPSASESEDSVSVVEARALREVETMQRCSSPHMIKVGPLGMELAQVKDQSILYFSEEFVDGSNLKARDIHAVIAGLVSAAVKAV